MAQKQLVLGFPRQTITIDGKKVPITDDVGLSMDPACYARADCSNCRGRGIFLIAVKGVGEPAPTSCHCAGNAYRKARVLVQAAFPKVGPVEAIMFFLRDFLFDEPLRRAEPVFHEVLEPTQVAV